MDYMIDDIKHSVVSVDNDTLMIDGTPYDIKIISINSNGIEFLLNKRYFQIIYAEESRGQMIVHVNGSPVTLKLHTGLDDIVYMNSGGAGVAMANTALQSQIPGKVVSVTVSTNDQVSEGDTICVLESMKMQVAIKAHTPGSIKSIRIKVGSSVAKGDIIAEIE